MAEALGKVLCIASHAVDLPDGRMVGPMETAENVDLEHDHVRDLVGSGHLVVQENATPRKRAADE